MARAYNELETAVTLMTYLLPKEICCIIDNYQAIAYAAVRPALSPSIIFKRIGTWRECACNYAVHQ